MPEVRVVGQLSLTGGVVGVGGPDSLGGGVVGGEEPEHESAFSSIDVHWPRGMGSDVWIFIPPFWPVWHAMK